MADLLPDVPENIVMGELGFQRFLFRNIIEDSIRSVNWIRDDFRDICGQYIRLGFHLDECKRYKYYATFGFSSFDDFVLKNFGMERSALSRCLNVFYEFALKQNDQRKMFLDKRYENYSYSQLVEMASMPAKDRRLVSSDMSVSQIREVKKNLRKNKSFSSVGISSAVPFPRTAEPARKPEAAAEDPEPEIKVKNPEPEPAAESVVEYPDEEPEASDQEPSFVKDRSFSSGKFNSLKGIAKINYLVKLPPELHKVGFACYTFTGKELLPEEAAGKLLEGADFDYIGYDLIRNVMIFRECEPETSLE